MRYPGRRRPPATTTTRYAHLRRTTTTPTHVHSTNTKKTQWAAKITAGTLTKKKKNNARYHNWTDTSASGPELGLSSNWNKNPRRQRAREARSSVEISRASSEGEGWARERAYRLRRRRKESKEFVARLGEVQKGSSDQIRLCPSSAKEGTRALAPAGAHMRSSSPDNRPYSPPPPRLAAGKQRGFNRGPPQTSSRGDHLRNVFSVFVQLLRVRKALGWERSSIAATVRFLSRRRRGERWWQGERMRSAKHGIRDDGSGVGITDCARRWGKVVLERQITKKAHPWDIDEWCRLTPGLQGASTNQNVKSCRGTVKNLRGTRL